MIALGAFSPDDPPAHANTPPHVLSSPLVLTPLLPPTSPSDQSLILELNVTSASSDVGHLTVPPARCAPLFLRTFDIEHLFKLGPSSSSTSFLLLESPSCQQLAIELNVTPVAFEVGSPDTSPGTAAYRCAPLCDGSNQSGHPLQEGKLGVPNQDMCPGAESLTGESRCPDESSCNSADRPLEGNFPLCDLRALGSTTPPSTLALLQPLESPSEQRVAIDLDVTQAVFGVGGLAISQSTTALQFWPVSDLGTLRSITSPSALTLLQPLESPPDPRVPIDLDVT